MKINWDDYKTNSVFDTNKYRELIEGDFLKSHNINNQKESLLLNYLSNNFYVEKGIFTPNIIKPSHIIRMERGSQILYGKEIMYELIKIFSFSEELTKEAIRYWLGDRYFDELWENQLEIKWQQSIDRMRGYISDTRIKLWDSVNLPSYLVNPNEA